MGPTREKEAPSNHWTSYMCVCPTNVHWAKESGVYCPARVARDDTNKQAIETALVVALRLARGQFEVSSNDLYSCMQSAGKQLKRIGALIKRRI